jgi:RNA polymerase sigma factor (sigma-70 family)
VQPAVAATATAAPPGTGPGSFGPAPDDDDPHHTTPPSADVLPLFGTREPSADAARLAACVQRMVRHDESGLEELYGCLGARVFRQVLRVVHDAALAEEAVEDTFWQAWRQAPRYDAARGPVVAWVQQIARSRALDALRAAGRNPLLEALALDDEAEDVAGAAGDESALDALDAQRRQLLTMAFVQGCSQAEIAQQTGLPLGTVKSHIRRGLAALKVMLQAQEPSGAGKGTP